MALLLPACAVRTPAARGDFREAFGAGWHEAAAAAYWPPIQPASDVGRPLRLEVRVVAGKPYNTLEVEVFNDSAEKVSIWKPGSSWGDLSFEIDVRAVHRGGTYTITCDNHSWTVNWPTPWEIPAGGSVTLPVDLFKPLEWRTPEECFSMRGPVEYRARLVIPREKETDKYDVLVCHVLSHWQVSETRTWLPDRAV
jgi:hypothetical protein